MALNLAGKKFNHLTVLTRLPPQDVRGVIWVCQCDCGKTLEVFAFKIINDLKKSCGCKEHEAKVLAARKKKGNHYLSFRGETRCISEWCEVLALSQHVLRSRLSRGWEVEKALTTPVYKAQEDQYVSDEGQVA